MSLFQPFDPEDFPGRKRLRQLQQVPIRTVFPNLVTLLALCAGLTAIRMSIEQRFELAILLIAVAAALDGIDGRMARFLKSASRFGAELDSITDFLNFGVAPVVLLYVWALDDLKSLGWIAALIFAICTALRLARFNVALDSAAKPEWHAAYFIGVPAPAAAMIVMLPIYLEFVGVPYGFLTAPLTCVYTLFVALLMVSRVPSWSLKLVGSRIERDYVLPLFVFAVLVAALFVSFTWQMMAFCTLLYLVCLPLSWRAYHRRLTTDASAGQADTGKTGAQKKVRE